MLTEKAIRANDQWVKITRDSNAHKFTFARGYAEVLQAHEEQSFSFEFMPTWAYAVEHAQRRMAVY